MTMQQQQHKPAKILRARGTRQVCLHEFEVRTTYTTHPEGWWCTFHARVFHGTRVHDVLWSVIGNVCVRLRANGGILSDRLAGWLVLLLFGT